jgi:hypothetical protein
MVHSSSAFLGSDTWPESCLPHFAFLGHNLHMPPILAVAIRICAVCFGLLGWMVFIFFTLIRATLRRNFEAGLLLTSLLLSLVAWIEAILRLRHE